MRSRKKSNTAEILQLEPETPRFGTELARVVALSDGKPTVEIAGLRDAPSRRLRAETSVDLSRTAVGARAVVMFLDGNPARPVIVGLLRDPADAEASLPNCSPAASEAQRDVTLEAQDRITLRCGKASISLMRDGRVEIRGVRLLSRASSTNRIRGGTIQLN